MSPMTTGSPAAHACQLNTLHRAARAALNEPSFMLFSCSVTFESDSQKLAKHPHLRGQLGLFKLAHNPAMFHDIEAIRQWGGETKILLGQNHGETPRFEAADHLAELLDDHGRETFGNLIQQQQPRTGAQD